MYVVRMYPHRMWLNKHVSHIQGIWHVKFKVAFSLGISNTIEDNSNVSMPYLVMATA